MNPKCPGCEVEMEECYTWQQVKGAVAGLQWWESAKELHCSHFVIDEKTNKFIVPTYA